MPRGWSAVETLEALENASSTPYRNPITGFGALAEEFSSLIVGILEPTPPHTTLTAACHQANPGLAQRPATLSPLQIAHLFTLRNSPTSIQRINRTKDSKYSRYNRDIAWTLHTHTGEQTSVERATVCDVIDGFMLVGATSTHILFSRTILQLHSIRCSTELASFFAADGGWLMLVRCFPLAPLPRAGLMYVS